ncbi:putative hydrolase [Fictibacillus macauensis ZFHKF-1]|uniref:Putative hydrolase n=2 Tax=Fictibacillus TaxID=1329200 RepID=I8AFF2_9BACL|nr:putative hydrolase [Fictibacillus macauensis ZFHKF-1]
MQASALLVIDVQHAFLDAKWGNRNNPQAEENIGTLLAHWRQQQWPVVHIQHTSDDVTSLFHPSNDGFAFKDVATPLAHEPIFTKKVNSAFIGTNLEAYLRDHHLTSVVICGLTTPHCVSTTTRMSGNLGFQTKIVADATAAFDLFNHEGKLMTAEAVHHAALTELHHEFAQIVTTEELIKKR